jgi:hypothetical protein
MTVNYLGSWRRPTPVQRKQAEPIRRHRDRPLGPQLQSILTIPHGPVVGLGLLVLRRCRVGARERIGRGGSVQLQVHPNLLGVFDTIRTVQVQ